MDIGLDILVGVVDGENFDFMFLKSVISPLKCYFLVYGKKDRGAGFMISSNEAHAAFR